MPNEKGNLYLFEAIELRAEYDARLATLNALLPENREVASAYSLGTSAERVRPVKAFSVEAAREEIESLRTRRRKLNTAIQRANYENSIRLGEQELALAEALELRKETNQEIGELTGQLKEAAYAKVIYKEERDIVEEPKQDFATTAKKLEAKRLLFRKLNRLLRQANHAVAVNFKDEPED